MMRALYFLLLRYTQAAKLGHRELRAASASGTLFVALTVVESKLLLPFRH